MTEPDKVREVEMQELESVAVGIAKEAGVLLKPHFGKIEVVRQKSPSGPDVVTDLDVKAENLIAKRLSTETPLIGFVGEESGNSNKKDKFWLVDPIDGTAHYIRGIPVCTTMIALIDKGEVVLSVINNFVTGEVFSASKNQGAKLNGKPIRVSDRSLSESYISIESRLDDEETVKKYLELKKVTTIFHTISCGYEYGLIASGKLEGRICINPYGDDYDYAPGGVLVKEAGGVVANIGFNSYNYKNHDFIATNPIIYKELTQGQKSILPVSPKLTL
ncbi:MAG: Inositol-phosphate phosphatase [Candidatus Curtissbacteria bacterium GW2011_GWA1_40_16]|uniref:Inositol-phosphate phosphatase n=1 Tax=Candidatus Curtissbacteria bacterium GW2011_GWA1_40_16 TaxID=1618405 RepID=A0A0G0UCG2_9BACT|nr:MAG: Inositol-phosphate phosphatase [Candidatus Curtissbacteria bacterium GW2011_GWA1_40_16]